MYDNNRRREEETKEIHISRIREQIEETKKMEDETATCLLNNKSTESEDEMEEERKDHLNM